MLPDALDDLIVEVADAESDDEHREVEDGDQMEVGEVAVPDAPFPDEIVVICAMANRGRMNARLGGLKADQIRGDGLR